MEYGVQKVGELQECPARLALLSLDLAYFAHGGPNPNKLPRLTLAN